MFLLLQIPFRRDVSAEAAPVQVAPARSTLLLTAAMIISTAAPDNSSSSAALSAIAHSAEIVFADLMDPSTPAAQSARSWSYFDEPGGAPQDDMRRTYSKRCWTTDRRGLVEHMAGARASGYIWLEPGRAAIAAAMWAIASRSQLEPKGTIEKIRQCDPN